MLAAGHDGPAGSLAMFWHNQTRAVNYDGPTVITDVATMPAISADSLVLVGIHSQLGHQHRTRQGRVLLRR